jgi:ribosomal protein L37AE/L43A
MTEKPCYNCHKIKNISDMKEIGVWVCNACLDKYDKPAKVKSKKLNSKWHDRKWLKRIKLW